jgi:hypothetical protein
MWGGHSCPPPLILKLILILDFNLIRIPRTNSKIKSKVSYSATAATAFAARTGQQALPNAIA